MKVVRNIEEIPISQWRDFVENHACGQAFMMPEMVELYNQTPLFQPVVCAVFDEQDAMCGLLVAVIQKDYKGLLGAMTSRSIIIGGPIVENNNSAIADLLLNDYLSLVKGKAIYTQFRNLYDMAWLHDELVSVGGKYEEHLDFIHDLTVGETDIVSGIDKNKRANVRKSLNKGMTFREIADDVEYDKCVELVFGTYKRIGLPCPSKEYFDNAYRLLYPSKILRVFVAVFEEEIIGCRLELICGKTIYDWWAGADDNQKNKYPNDFIPYHILLWGAENEYSIFDFGGAGKPNVPYGVREHKRKFGGKMVNFGRYEIVHKPLFMAVGKLCLPVYRFLKKKLR